MAEDKTVKIIVAAHKAFRMPEDEMYVPLHVGADCKPAADGPPLSRGYLNDNTGDNISIKNPGYCELTGLYWAWKNLESDYIGLVHYRRHFCLHRTRDPFDGVLKYSEIKPLLDKTRVFLPKRGNIISRPFTATTSTPIISHSSTRHAALSPKDARNIFPHSTGSPSADGAICSI